MMKRTAYILTLLAALLMVGCKHHSSSTEGLTDSEKLEVLDFRIEKHPTDHAALAERAEVLLRLGRVKEAVVDIDKAVGQSPDNIDYRLEQADIHFATGDVEASYRALSEAERLAPQRTDVQLKMGEVMFYSRDFDRALVCLSKVTATEPDNRIALFMKGHIYKETGDTASAVQLLRRVCDLYPDYEPAFEELGILYSTRQNPLAAEYLSTALELQPSNTNAIYALAMYFQEGMKLSEAETMYHRLLDINDKSADAWHNLGYIALFYRDNYEQAIEYLTRAIEADPTHIAAYTTRANAYELNNQIYQARADYQTALELDPTYPPAVEGMKRLK